ncbi:MAG: alpha/beta hydrolase [Promethearchaeota archaeon]
MVKSQIPTYYSAFEDVPEEFKLLLFERSLPYHRKHDPPSDTIVLCLHGFSAAPFEIKAIADAIYDAGMDVAAPIQPFHGYKEVEDQKKYWPRMSKDIMFNAAKLEISKARQQYKNVFMYGQSMGGAITLSMASLGLVDAAASTAPAIRISPFSRFLAKLLWAFNMNMMKKDPDSHDTDHYRFNNSRAAKELLKIADFAKENLENINVPVFVCHSHNDDTIDGPVTVGWMQEKIKDFKVSWFDESEHERKLPKKLQISLLRNVK